MPFSLEAVFGVDASGVRAEIKSLRKDLNDFVNDYGKLGVGLAVGAFVALSKGAIDLAADLKKTSLEVGIGVDKLQVLDALANRNGESQDTLRKALEKTRLSMQEAATGNTKLAAAYAVLGVNLAEVQRLPLEQKFTAIARGLVQAQNQQAAYNAIAEIFGAKVGPQLINSLTELGTEGFAKAAASAAEAGQIMSSETIVALEKAQSAVEEFKKRATIAVGEIIVNFRSEEGLKLLGEQFLKVVGQFGAGIVDAVYEGYNAFKSFFGTVGIWIRERVQNGLIDAIAAAGEALNKILPKKYQIDVGNLDKFRVASEDFSNILARTIAETKPLNFQKTVGDYWDGVIKDQQKIVDSLNKVDFGKEAVKLTNAGKQIESSLKVGSDGIVAASSTLKSAIAQIAQRTEELYAAARAANPQETGQHITDFAGVPIVTYTQEQLDGLPPDVLNEIIRRSKQGIDQLEASKYQDNPTLGPEQATGFFYRSSAEDLLLTNIIRAKATLSQNNSLTGDRSAALENYSGSLLDFDTLYGRASANPETVRTNTLLATVTDSLATISTQLKAF